METVKSLNRHQSNSHAHRILGVLLVSAIFWNTLAGAQEDSSQARSVSLMEEIVVTSQKKSVGESVQDIPVAMTAVSDSQLDSLNFRSLRDIAIISPNASLETNGNSRSHANFTIRGTGANSSIPSIEAAVGLFINGVYQGIPSGSVVENFDLQSVEILRGPQGTLFGRNVTGGAVIVETKRPSGERGGEIAASLETGLEYGVSAAYETSLSPGKVDARIALLYREDDGWFENDFDDSDFGASDAFIIRPTVRFTPSDSIEQTFIFEHGEGDGDGAPEQALNARGDFELNLNQPGFSDYEWTSLTSETNIDVAFGEGVITNVLGWREYEANFLADIDATGLSLFHAYNHVDQEQVSNELRYAGRFNNVDITLGGFFFSQDVALVEERNLFHPVLLRVVTIAGGGQQDHESLGLFAQAHWHLTDQLTLAFGLRYSSEEKEAQVVPLVPGGICSSVSKSCELSFATVDDDDDWNSVSPRLGVEYRLNEDTMLYATYSEATRSGGYNLRISGPADPGIFDQEEVANYELGIKADLSSRVRLNAAVFRTDQEDLQRSVLATIGTNITQTLTNAADARINGFEADLVVSLTDGVELMLNAGYADMEYTEVFYDLNADGLVNEVDEGLDSPRVSPWSGGATLLGYFDMPSGASLQARISYNYRDEAAANDANTAFYEERKDLSANVTYVFPGQNVELSVYGRNLTEYVPDTGAKLPVPPFPSGGFRAIGEGRSIGAAVKVSF